MLRSLAPQTFPLIGRGQAAVGRATDNTAEADCPAMRWRGSERALSRAVTPRAYRRGLCVDLRARWEPFSGILGRCVELGDRET